jgi:Fe-S oxidoreductase
MGPIADSNFWLIRGRELFLCLHLIGFALFLYILARRVRPLLAAERDPRFDHPLKRLGRVLRYWLGQWRHPRFRYAGALHILIFAAFLILASRAFSLLALGVSSRFEGPPAAWYEPLRSYAATMVFLCMAVAAFRRRILRPKRYPRSADAIFLLGLIALLMLADAVFEGTEAAAGGRLPPLYSLAWLAAAAMANTSYSHLTYLHQEAYLVHEAAFFFLLCYRPFGIQFHVESSLFSIWFSKLDRASLKPVRWGVPEEALDQLPSLGVKRIEDFTWKHILDFYSCADCGRCAEMCPSNAVGRPLAPRAFSIKARDYVFQRYPVFGESKDGLRLVGGVFSEEEIWSCTTCGSCEAECPLFVEYIDKIVDLRRGLVDDGAAPQSLHKPLQAVQSRGNPFGKLEKRRADWAKGIVCTERTDTLYFVDSITSYDERMQSIARSTARVLQRIGQEVCLLGPKERDSGHDVRRFGEETLFQSLRAHNTEAIRSVQVRRVVTADPHAFHALRHDYTDLPPVEHVSQTIAAAVRSGHLRMNTAPEGIYTYHDPCYLGRHNGEYDAPRDVLDSIPGLRRVEMKRSRDRSFCCGGSGLALFYEAKEQERMGVRRIRMAAEAGANVIVTACPFCMANIEDAIKVAGLEGQMSVTDLAELVDRVTEAAVAT